MWGQVTLCEIYLTTLGLVYKVGYFYERRWSQLTLTGRELLIYILSNNLENEIIYKDGKLNCIPLGLLTEFEAAKKFNVGTATILTWVRNGQLEGVKIGNRTYIPVNATRPKNNGTNV